MTYHKQQLTSIHWALNVFRMCKYIILKALNHLHTYSFFEQNPYHYHTYLIVLLADSEHLGINRSTEPNFCCIQNIEEFLVLPWQFFQLVCLASTQVTPGTYGAGVTAKVTSQEQSYKSNSNQQPGDLL